MVVLCFLQVFRSSNYAYTIGKKGRRFQLCHQFLAILPSRSRCGNVPNELIHRAGLPFLDNHFNREESVSVMDITVVTLHWVDNPEITE